MEKSYIIIAGNAIGHLEDQVNKYLKEGYTLVGGLVIGRNDETTTGENYYQTMLKNNIPKKKARAFDAFQAIDT